MSVDERRNINVLEKVYELGSKIMDNIISQNEDSDLLSKPKNAAEMEALNNDLKTIATATFRKKLNLN